MMPSGATKRYTLPPSKKRPLRARIVAHSCSRAEAYACRREHAPALSLRLAAIQDLCKPGESRFTPGETGDGRPIHRRARRESQAGGRSVPTSNPFDVIAELDRAHARRLL